MEDVDNAIELVLLVVDLDQATVYLAEKKML